MPSKSKSRSRSPAKKKAAPPAGVLTASNVFKANAAFLGFFSLQFVFCPLFLIKTNFTDKDELDEFHIFLMRGFGVLALGFCYLLTQIDAEKFLPYMTAFMILFCASLPFYAQMWMKVRLPEHYLPVAGCAALIAAHVYLVMPSKLSFDAATVTKASALFFGFFSLQFLLCPEFLTATNFTGVKLDKYHLFVCQGFGVLGLFFCGLLWQLDAEKFLPFLTAWTCAFSAVMPLYAQTQLPVKLPDHYMPLAGCGALSLAYLVLYLQSK